MFTVLRWNILLTTVIYLSLIGAQDNPSILEDSRVHPTSDGSFGFLYRTQDGIAHAAKGDPGGAVHGRFTYTDPTGLKVNFNYNAGAQAVKEQHAPQPQYIQPIQKPQPQRGPDSQQSLLYRPVGENQEQYIPEQYEKQNEQRSYEQHTRYQPDIQSENDSRQSEYRPQISPILNDNNYNSRFTHA